MIAITLNEGDQLIEAKLLSEDVLKKVEEVKAKILSGEIVVPGTKAEFEKEYGDKYELD